MTELYRIKQLTEFLNISRATIYRLIKRRQFPAPKKLGGISVWTKEDIEEWVNIVTDP